MTLPKSADLGSTLQHALVETLAMLATALAHDDMSAREVHQARRAAKQARALVRLAPAAFDALVRQTATIVRQARRGLGGARDADVRRATLDKLRKRLGPTHDRLAPAIGADIGAAEKNEREGLRITLGALIHEWRAADMRDADDEILEAVIAGYRKARRRMPDDHTTSADDLHRWRSAVVDHEYQTAFLNDVSRRAARQSARADKLRQRLGQIHDIDALLEFMERSEDASVSGARDDVAQAAAPRRDKRTAAARRLGEKMFSEKPRTWARLLRREISPVDG